MSEKRLYNIRIKVLKKDFPKINKSLKIWMSAIASELGPTYKYLDRGEGSISTLDEKSQFRGQLLPINNPNNGSGDIFLKDLSNKNFTFYTLDQQNSIEPFSLNDVIKIKNATYKVLKYNLLYYDFDIEIVLIDDSHDQ